MRENDNQSCLGNYRMSKEKIFSMNLFNGIKQDVPVRMTPDIYFEK